MTIRTTRKSLNSLASCALLLALSLVVPLGGAARADLGDKVNEALSRIKRIQSQVNQIPRDGVFRTMLEQVDPAVVSGLVEAAGDAREVLDLVRAKREGFDAYKTDGGADRMRSDLLFFIEDVRHLAMATQQLRCIDDPEIKVVPMEVRFIRDAIQKMPAIVLFSTQKMLDEMMPDWRTALQPILESLPVDQISQLCGAPSEIEEQLKMAKCDVLRLVQPHQVRRTKRLAGVTADALDVVVGHMKDEITVGVAAVVAGGGGATISVKNHLRAVLKAVHTMLSDPQVKSIMKINMHIVNERKACLDADERMERDLLSCTALASYDSNFTTIHDLALRRVESLPVSSADVDSIHYANDFHQLCSAYQDVRNPRRK